MRHDSLVSMLLAPIRIVLELLRFVGSAVVNGVVAGCIVTLGWVAVTWLLTVLLDMTIPSKISTFVFVGASLLAGGRFAFESIYYAVTGKDPRWSILDLNLMAGMIIVWLPLWVVEVLCGAVSSLFSLFSTKTVRPK